MQPRYLNETRLASIIAEFFVMVEYCCTHGELSLRETDCEWQDASKIMARETGIPVTRVHDDMTAYAAHQYGTAWLDMFTAQHGEPYGAKRSIRTLANVACEKILRSGQKHHRLG
uniref:Uncharacterized protein n=1 Tax=mine drainage metagenome TaxID=410659 RepID=E6QVX0_9ZZZZ